MLALCSKPSLDSESALSSQWAGANLGSSETDPSSSDDKLEVMN